MQVARTLVLMAMSVACLANATAQSTAGNDAAVYSIALEQRYHGGIGAKYPVIDTTIAIRLSAELSKGTFQFAAVPAELRRMALQQKARNHPISAAVLPPGTRIVPATTRADERASWLALSPVLYTRDGLDAFVYASAYCGGLCAEDAYIWVHRDMLASSWKLAKRIGGIVS